MPLQTGMANSQKPRWYVSDRPISERRAMIISRPSRGALPRQFEVAVALQQCALTAAGSMAAGLRSPGASEISLAVCRGPSRIFRGTSDQVAAVRRFVRSEFGEHLALDDAVLVASELAANAVVHTASGQPGGIFMAHLATVSVDHVAILITDQGRASEPSDKHPEANEESGRGLAVITELAALLVSYGDDTVRSMLAVIGGTALGAPG